MIKVFVKAPWIKRELRTKLHLGFECNHKGQLFLFSYVLMYYISEIVDQEIKYNDVKKLLLKTIN